jgi:hypothetical protein
MGWHNSPSVPADPTVTQFQPGDPSPLKMLKVVRWALQRGGTFTALELRARFGTSKCMAYDYTRYWRQVFGDQPPPRARKGGLKQGTEANLKPITLDSLLDGL